MPAKTPEDCHRIAVEAFWWCMRTSRVTGQQLISIIVFVSTLGMLSGCSGVGHPAPASSFPTNASFTRTIDVFLVDGGRIFRYRVALDAGRVEGPAELDQSTFARVGLVPGANSPTTVRAPNAEYWAQNDGDGITVFNKQGSQVGRLPIGRGNRVTGIAWSPDSRALATLFQRDRNAWLCSRGVMGLLSGHPPTLTTYQLILYSPGNGLSIKLPVIRNDVEGGWGAVSWVSDSG